MLKAYFTGLIDFLFPKTEGVRELEALTPGELARLLPPPYSLAGLGEDTLALFSYPDDRVRALVWELKYRGNLKLAESLAVLVYDALSQELADRMLFDNFTRPLLIPMPMSRDRKRDRGWNQTEVLGEAIVKLDDGKIFEYSPNALIKAKHTESQTLTENKKRRLRNVEGSMKAKGVSGRNVVLLDDVTTTGATFRESKRALRESGALKILCVALAH